MKKIFCSLIILYFASTLAFPQDTDKRLLPIKLNSKWGYINISGKLIIPPQFDGAEEFSEGDASIQLGGKWGYIDPAGKIVIKPQYDYAGKFSDGLAVVQINESYGYINKNGMLAIKFQFVYAEDFENGIANVMIKLKDQPNSKHSYINKAGEPITDLNVVTLLSEGLILVREENKKGFIDSSGKIIIPLQFDDAHSFVEGLAVVKNNFKWGCIDKTGKYIIPTKYDLIKNEFSEGMMSVSIDGKWGFCDKSGQLKINPIYNDVGSFSDGLVSVTINGKSGYINKEGKTIIEPLYSKAFKFYNEIARVTGQFEVVEGTEKGKMKDGWQLINKTGLAVSNVLFVKDINRFEEGVACVRELDNKYRYINQKGGFTTKIKFDRASPWLRDGVAQVFLGKKMGYIDKAGKYLWEPTE